MCHAFMSALNSALMIAMLSLFVFLVVMAVLVFAVYYSIRTCAVRNEPALLLSPT